MTQPIAMPIMVSDQLQQLHGEWRAYRRDRAFGMEQTEAMTRVSERTSNMNVHGDVVYRAMVGLTQMSIDGADEWLDNAIRSALAFGTPTRNVFGRRLRDPLDGMIPRGQAAGAARREQARNEGVIRQEGHIDWERRDEVWVGPDGHPIAIASMLDNVLYDKINYCVRNVASLHRVYASDSDKTVLPKCWLRDRYLFRCLAREAGRRSLTFGNDVYTYLRDYVYEDRDTSDAEGPEYQPWRDPALAAVQSATMQRLGQIPLERAPSTLYGAPRRVLDLE